MWLPLGSYKGVMFARITERAAAVLSSGFGKLSLDDIEIEPPTESVGIARTIFILELIACLLAHTTLSTSAARETMGENHPGRRNRSISTSLASIPA